MPLLFAVLLASLASTPNHVVVAPSAEKPGVLDIEKKCANATSHLARRGAVLRSDPARPQKLTELPDAEIFAAVYRLENGCAVPVLYRETHEVRPPKR
jgi:hypothetical protein